jgi:hypothetical protein
MPKDLTAKDWIETHGAASKGAFTLSLEQLDEFLTHFILPHKQCNCYSKGLCTNGDAPKPGHSRCIGTHLCLSPSYPWVRR